MSSHYPPTLDHLILQLRRLPGVGARTAERLALALCAWPAAELREFGTLLAALPERLRPCTACGNLAEAELCAICRDPSRRQELVCVVEQASQIPVIEKAGCYRGLYHVLGGRLEPLAQKGPESLRLRELQARLAAGTVTELILATSSDVEGEATAAWLAQECCREGLAITRLAAGLPVGADLGYADAATIAAALQARRAW
ncbi:MAG: recombination mediator RecR [Lentisphaeria bacterium]|jgi:recombination protein RecR